MKVNQKNYVNFAFLILFLGILFTVTITDDFLWQGVVTAKYFWFATVMCIVSVLIPLSLPKKGEIHVTDLLLGILVVYFCVNYFFLNNHPGMHWWLTLLMVPLYVAVRVTAANGNMRRWLTDALLVVVLVEAVWGLLQLYGFTYSNHSLYKVTGSLFNPGPYSGFVAVGIPLALGYALDKTLPRWERWLGIVTLAAALLVLPVAMSRAAWLAAITGSAVTVIQNSRFKIQNSRLET